jgi:uncharacterized membrane protein YhaH (DUF805 family)
VVNNNWIGKDLFVWPEGRLSRGGYFLALIRVVIIYVFAAQILTVFSPSLFGTFNSGEPADIFHTIKWAQIGAVAIIAFPIWSLFQRRLNDMRPDISKRLAPWSVAFPIILVGLIGLMLANAAGVKTPLDDADLSQIRFWFPVMLFGSAFVPGGDKVPESVMKKANAEKAKPMETAPSQFKLPGISQSPAAAWKPEPRSAPRHQPIPANPVMANQAVQRQHKLPEQGRVKPGWFS